MLGWWEDEEKGAMVLGFGGVWAVFDVVRVVGGDRGLCPLPAAPVHPRDIWGQMKGGQMKGAVRVEGPCGRSGVAAQADHHVNLGETGVFGDVGQAGDLQLIGGGIGEIAGVFPIEMRVVVHIGVKIAF